MNRTSTQAKNWWASYVAHMVYLPGSTMYYHIVPTWIFGNWHGVDAIWVNHGYATENPLIAHMGSMHLIDVGSIYLIDVGSMCLIDMGYI